MREVILETEAEDGWSRIGSQSEVEPPGSFDTEGPVGREVILFGWYEGKAGVWQSRAGIDQANAAVRVIDSIGLDLLSDLAEPYEFNRRGRLGVQRLRFRLEET